MTFVSELRPPDPAFFAFTPEVRASLRGDDRFLVSYPRSGNTWMRYVLTAGCLLQRGEELPMSEAGIARVFELTALVVPDLHATALDPEPHPMSGVRHRVIKSHNVREVCAHEVVYLFRRPEDSLLSYAHYAGRAGEGADRFVIRQVRTWAAEAEFALDCHRENPGRFSLMSYERMLERTSESAGLIAERLGMRIAAAHLERAIELNDFRRLASFEQQAGVKAKLAPAGEFFRRGGEGSGRSELRRETIEIVRTKAQPTYERLCEAAADAV